MEESPSQENKEKINLRILYADDDPDLRRSIGRILRHRYRDVVIVESGQALLDKLSEEGENFDLILSDNSMPISKDDPGLTGLEVLQRIRETETLKDLPFILYTTDMGSTQEDVESLGGLFLSKSVDFDDLYTEIERLANPEISPEAQ